MWQAHSVAEMIRRSKPGIDVVVVTVDTAGDRRVDRSIAEIGGQGVFVKEVQAAVLDGRADIAVHSAKDLPSATPDGLLLAAVPVRADPRDVLVGSTLEGLAPGAMIATGSRRRMAQLAWLRPDLTFTGLRGNIASRLEKIPPGGAIVMAAAALERLRLTPEVSYTFELAEMVPQVGQGALALECRKDDPAAEHILACINELGAFVCVQAERAFLSSVGGGCDLPVGAHARLDGGQMKIEGVVGSADGRVILRDRRSGSSDDPARLGAELASSLLAAGGAELLDGDTGGAETLT
jgi:hydroxymethylbilane synthase